LRMVCAWLHIGAKILMVAFFAVLNIPGGGLPADP
jgi:hypothetical protein